MSYLCQVPHFLNARHIKKIVLYKTMLCVISIPFCFVSFWRTWFKDE